MFVKIILPNGPWRVHQEPASQDPGRDEDPDPDPDPPPGLDDAQMRVAAAVARPFGRPRRPDHAHRRPGPWLAAEYTAVHGQKAPRP
jgi:hypothetical protein